MKEFDETMLHQFLPTTSFPSDHAVVTFSIAMATFLIAHKNNSKKLRIWSYFLFLIAIITVLCRI
jgi:membrane-associated phospholipid phosphatase